MTYQSDEFQSKRANLEAELDDVQAGLSSETHESNTEISPVSLAEKAQLEAHQAEIAMELKSLNTLPTGTSEV